MRVTVCELPHESAALPGAWAALAEHTARRQPELVLLPEFAFVGPVWEADAFDPGRWTEAMAESDAGIARLAELGAVHVVGARPATEGGRPFNEGFLWTAGQGVTRLRRKYYLPDDPGGHEARWFDRGDAAFPAFHAGPLAFGLNICTELWALETYPAYAAGGIHAVLAPRATAAATTARWLSVGVVAAVRSGAFCLSSNRVDRSGAAGGVGWIISPEGRILATTTPAAPFVTLDLDLAVPAAARLGYPCAVLRD
ncbi:MAG TPA: carbon-nitrogen hydrolase family protein [Gemmatimonadales bacterium]|jgi:N-carbamoylputrescine amidase|nr:carbon-nitrogen hydrolase family protein [Gemmatimonadales bacterium]